ncbi:MAG: hypothetical protein C4291_10730 [Candidatus Dadabacteria bacterium]
MRFVGFLVAFIGIPAIVFIPLRERLYAQSVLENTNPSKSASEPFATVGEKKIIIIVINKRGEILINKKRYSLSGIKAEMSKLMKSHSENINDVDVFVRADANTSYITLVNLISEIKETGVKRVWLVT